MACSHPTNDRVVLDDKVKTNTVKYYCNSCGATWDSGLLYEAAKTAVVVVNQK